MANDDAGVDRGGRGRADNRAAGVAASGVDSNVLRIVVCPDRICVETQNL